MYVDGDVRGVVCLCTYALPNMHLDEHVCLCWYSCNVRPKLHDKFPCVRTVDEARIRSIRVRTWKQRRELTLACLQAPATTLSLPEREVGRLHNLHPVSLYHLSNSWTFRVNSMQTDIYLCLFPHSTQKNGIKFPTCFLPSTTIPTQF